MMKAKQLAAELLLRDLDILTDYWEERSKDTVEGLTEKQLMAVQLQVDKYKKRIEKILGG